MADEAAWPSRRDHTSAGAGEQQPLLGRHNLGQGAQLLVALMHGQSKVELPAQHLTVQDVDWQQLWRPWCRQVAAVSRLCPAVPRLHDGLPAKQQVPFSTLCI